MNKNRHWKKGLAFALAMTTSATMLAAPVALPLAGQINGFTRVQAAEETTTVATNISTHAQLEVNGQVTDMMLIGSNTYLAKAGLIAGDNVASVLLNGAETGISKTVSMEAEADHYFTFHKNNEGKFILDEGDKNPLIHTEALVGNFMGLEFLSDPEDETGRYDISSWNPGDDKAELKDLGNGIYGRTFYFKELTADLEVKDGGYKVAEDDAWTVSYNDGKGGDNIALTIPAGTKELTVAVDRYTGQVKDSVRTEGLTLENAKDQFAGGKKAISLVGTVRNVGDDNWNAANTGFDFTQMSSNLYVYQQTLAAGKYEYKINYDHSDWAGDANHQLTLNKETTVTYVYNADTDTYIDSVNNEEEVAQLLQMDTAVAKFSVLQNANGTTHFTVPTDGGKNVVLHYKEDGADGTFATKDLTKTAEGKYETDIFFGDAAKTMDYYVTIDGQDMSMGGDTVLVDEKSCLQYDKPAYEGRMVSVPGTIGSRSWDPGADIMTYDGDERYSYTFKDVAPGGHQYKIAIDGSWGENYGADGIPSGANIDINVPETMDVTIYYNDESHKAQCSLDYEVADINLIGDGIPAGTKLTDPYLNGIYSARVTLPAGDYQGIHARYEGKDKNCATYKAFTLNQETEVTFYFDPKTGVAYASTGSSADKINSGAVIYDTHDTTYKSVYGAVKSGEEVTFAIDTGSDVTEMQMVLTGANAGQLDMAKVDGAEKGQQRWAVTTTFDKIGESHYFFFMNNGSEYKVYGDDDGYYGTGKMDDLATVLPYDLITYDKDFKTPDWMKNGVIYQIFPDRFCNGDKSNDKAVTSARGEQNYEFIEDWNTIPENPDREADIVKNGEVDSDLKAAYEASGAYQGDGNWSNEIYGGDLEGIEDRIPYLKALGVNVLYINPAFSSISSHRYDTSDYSKVDPILGDQGDFAALVKAADENGMKIILDGVFNHVSDDSVYFDRYYKYLESGATNSQGKKTVGAYPYWAYVYDYMKEKSADQETAEAAAKKYFTDNYGIEDFSYTEWFEVRNEIRKDEDGNEIVDNIGDRKGRGVYTYEGWAGYDSMPVIKSTGGSEFRSGNWGSEIIQNANDNAIAQYWLTQGSDGWRLDVANEVSDETWQHLRESVKALNSDNVIIGEIWTDATKYLVGDMYDSVMNYVYRGAVLGYAKGGTSDDANKALEKMRERYPQEAFYTMMNLTGSHDVARLLSNLDGVADNRDGQTMANAFPTYEKTSDFAKQAQKLVALMQFTYGGAPTIYYGDELGMTGAADPDNRRAMIWGQGNKDLVEYYAKLAAIRAAYPTLRTGSIDPFVVDDNVMGYVRKSDEDRMMIVFNNSAQDKEVTLDLSELGMTEEEAVSQLRMLAARAPQAGKTYTDMLAGGTFTSAGNLLTVNVPAQSGLILTDDPKEITVDTEPLAIGYDADAWAKASAADQARAAARHSKSDDGKDDSGKSDEGKDKPGKSDGGKSDSGKTDDQKVPGKSNGSQADQTNNNSAAADGKTGSRDTTTLPVTSDKKNDSNATTNAGKTKTEGKSKVTVTSDSPKTGDTNEETETSGLGLLAFFSGLGLMVMAASRRRKD